MAEVDIKNQKGTKNFKPEVVKRDTRKADENLRTTNSINRNLNDYNTLIRTSKDIQLKGSARLKLPDLSATPTTCQVGEMVVISGVLNICSATDTFTVVGTQS